MKNVESFLIIAGKQLKFQNNESDLKIISNIDLINKSNISNISKFQGLIKNKNELINLKISEIEKLNWIIKEQKISRTNDVYD